MRGMTGKNTLWRDVYRRAWTWGLVAAILAHAAVFFFMPRGLADRFHEAMIPSPTAFAVAGGAGSEIEVLALRFVNPVETAPVPPPEAVPEQEALEIVPAEVTFEEAVSEATGPATEAEGEVDGTPEGTGETASAAGGGPGGVLSAPRPLHLVVPRIPDGVDRKKARGQTIHLLVHVLPDGSVGEVRIEKGSRLEALDTAALSAARRSRYIPASRDGVAISQWTRTEMRFY